MLLTWSASSGLNPTLSLDFLTPVLDGRITASGGANGTRVNSSGLIVAATTPRFDYDPVTLAIKGLLVEEARTNLVLHNRDMTNAVWNSIGTGVTANFSTAPDGTLTADRLEFTDATSQLYQFVSGVSTSTTYTMTGYAKMASGTGDFRFKWYNAQTASDVLSADQAVTANWQRFSFTFTTGNDVSSFNIALYAGTSGAQNVEFWGVGLEQGSFATSYIPTVSATVTRTADSLTMTGTNFSSWFNASEGTFVVEFEPPAVLSTFPVLLGHDSGSTAGLYLFSNTVGHWNGSVDLSIAETVIQGVSNKMALAFSGTTSRAIALNGGTVAEDANSAGSFDGLFFGKPGGAANQVLNSHIRSLRFYPRRLSNSQLQVLT